MRARNIFFHLWLLKSLFLPSAQNKSYKCFNNVKANDRLTKIMIKIIQNCYDNNAEIALSGDWNFNDNFAINKIFNIITPVYIVGLQEDVYFAKHKRLKNVYKLDYRLISKKKYPVKKFIITINSDNMLQMSLKMLKDSVLWNHEGFFLIVHHSGCNNATTLLYLIWSYRILSATLLCYDNDEEIQLFTFNPFTCLATKFWSKIDKDDEKNGNWTLYRRTIDSSFNNYESLCENLNFDKTINLGGYNLKLGAHVHPKLLSFDKRKVGFNRFGGVNGEICQAIFTFLNVTANVTFYENSGYIDEHGTLKSFLHDLVLGKIDFAMNMNLIRDFWKLQTYPHETAGFCLITRRDTIALIEQFELMFDRKVWLIFGFACFLLTIILKFVMIQNAYSSVILEFIRIIVNVPLIFHSNRIYIRILITSLTLFAMLLNVHFYGRLTSLDIVPGTNPTIDTDLDLIKSKLNIYGTLQYNELVPDLNVRERYRFSKFKECIGRLVKGQLVICIAGCYEAKFDVTDSGNLHLSKELRRFYMSFSVIEDWPLYTRFNTLLMRLNEAGLIKLYRVREAYTFSYQTENHIEEFVGLFKKNMKVYWYLWICGLTIAFILFVLEICCYKLLDAFKLCYVTNSPIVPDNNIKFLYS